MIGINLKKFQEKAVDFLYDKTTTNIKNTITIQSPTGSGKTIILVSYIEKYITYIDNVVFCWFCPGKGELEEQSKEKMEKYAPNLKTGNIFDVLNNGFENRGTYFINWEIVTKKGNKAISDTERNNLFDCIKKAHQNGLKFIIIIDEEHQNNTSKANEIIRAISAEYEIRVSATPIKRVLGEKYVISEIDVINEGLITKAMYVNRDLDNILVDNIETETDILIEKADNIRKQIINEYINQNEYINPLVLIQFPNLNDDLIERVENKLELMGYTYSNKKVASWFSVENKYDEKMKSKKLGKINIGIVGMDDSITNNDAEPSFLLFKQALATGWDCPRAKILVKLRENMSENFEIQTLGRLRRMPKAKHYDIDILDCSFLYTFDEKYKLAAINAGGFETQRLFLKEKPKTITLVKELRNNDSDYVDERRLRNLFYEYFKTKYNLEKNKIKNKIILENNGYILGSEILGKFLSGKFIKLIDLEQNKNFDIRMIKYNVDTHKHGIELRHNIDILKKYTGLNYSRTRALLENLFRVNEGTDKYKFLDLTLKEFYAFIINNIQLLKETFYEFGGLSRQLSFETHKVKDFKIPLEEHYRYSSDAKNIKVLNKNVYKEYNTSMITDDFRSIVERLFEKYCENNNKVKYIYKNGDSGQNYLSIVYRTNFNIQKLFYPDYIVQLMDESIWVIETKGGETKGQSKNIDIQVKNKFNEFKRYCESYNYKFAFVRDKDGELYYNNTEYIDDMKNENWKNIEEIF